MIEITKVEKFKNPSANRLSLHVYYTDNGVKKGIFFVSAEQALEIVDGEEKFKKIIRDTIKIKPKQNTPDNKEKIEELKEYKGKKI